MSPDSIDDLLRYREAVVRFIMRLGFPRHEAEDVTQDVFTRVSKNKDKYRGEGRWAFLETAARYEAFNAIRKKKAKMRAGGEVSFDDLPHLQELSMDPWTGQSSPSPEQQLIDREEAAVRVERARRLAAAVGNLRQGTRTCFQFWLAGLKYTEIAETMKITVNTVKSRLHEARQELRERLGEEPGGVAWPESGTEDDDG